MQRKTALTRFAEMQARTVWNTAGTAVFALAMVGAFPAAAQRSCSVSVRADAPKPATAPLVKPATLATLQPFALESQPKVLVTGGGIAVLTDPDGEQFQNQFSIAASVYADGTARGHVNFVFSSLFSLKWGAVPGVSEIMHLQGEITSGSVGEEGVRLIGPFVETDYAPGEGVVYKEDSRQSGSAPIEIVVKEGSRAFLLTWCAFIPPAGSGYFSLALVKGNLKVHTISK